MLPIPVDLSTAAEVSQTAQRAVTDLTPIWQAVIGAASGIITALGAVASWYITTMLRNKAVAAGFQVSEAQRALWDQEIRKAIGFAVSRGADVTGTLVTTGTIPANTKSDLINDALGYMKTHSVEILKQQGLLDKDGKIDQGYIERSIEARLGMIQVSQAVAPATLASATESTAPAPAPLR